MECYPHPCCLGKSLSKDTSNPSPINLPISAISDALLLGNPSHQTYPVGRDHGRQVRWLKLRLKINLYFPNSPDTYNSRDLTLTLVVIYRDTSALEPFWTLICWFQNWGYFRGVERVYTWCPSPPKKHSQLVRWFGYLILLMSLWNHLQN